MTDPGTFPSFLTEWREINGPDFTPISYLYQPAATSFVIAARWLYIPEFVEYRGGVFRTEFPRELSDKKREELDEWFDELNGDMPKVEWLGNLFPLWG